MMKTITKHFKKHGQKYGLGLLGGLLLALALGGIALFNSQGKASAQAVPVYTWQVVGTPGFSPSYAFSESLTFDSNNAPYLAYKDGANGQKVTVMTFNGTSWLPVGTPGFSAGQINSRPFLAIDSNGTLYVAYSDGANGNKATVMTFNGTSWVPVGTRISAGFAGNPSLAIDSHDILYVVYGDGPIGSKTTVMTFNGTSWVPVGTPGFSAGPAQQPSLAIDSYDTLYVVYGDSANGQKATVMKFDGTNWVPVGTPGFSAGPAYGCSLAIDSNGTLYVAYSDGAYSQSTTVMTFNGSSWIPVGTPGFGAPYSSPSFAINSNNIPYVAYRDTTNAYKATVMTFNGTSWVPVGTPGFSAGGVQTPFLAINNNNILYLAYADDVYNQKATVIKYDINPDRDHDGIIDIEDQCPDINGSLPFKGCPAGVRVSVQELNTYGTSKAIKTDTALSTKIFSTDAESCASAIGAQPENYSRIFNGCVPEVAKNETNSLSNLINDLITIGVTTGTKLVLVQSQVSVDGSYGYIGFELPNMLADQSRDLGFNVVPGQDTFVQTSIFTKNSKGIRQSERRAQVIKGSELQIFQPDYVLRNGTEQIYPFLFISDSDWNVDVCLEVPEGYTVAGGSCIQTFVANEVKVIEFTTIDVGSPEKFDATAKFNVTHKGKKTKVDLKIKSINSKADQKKGK